MQKLFLFGLTVLTAANLNAQPTCTILQNDTTICRGNSLFLTIDTTILGTACTVGSLPSPLQNGLVAFYPFCGNANDQSGNGNHGTVNGAVLTTDRLGIANRAYSFNGNQYIIGSASNYPTGTRTVSLWFYATNIGATIQGPTLIGYGGNSCGQSWFQVIDNAGTPMGQQNTYQVQGHCNNESVLYSYGATHPNNSWHHWVITTAPGGTKFYIDGALVLTDTTFINETYVQGKDFIFGGPVSTNGLGFYTDGNIYGLTGKLDDIFIYNRELSSSEITLLYQSQIISWSTGASTTGITVSPTQTTTYYATVTDSISTCIDSVRITISTVDTSILVLDPTTICSVNGSVRMRAGIGATYQWLRNSLPIAGSTFRDYTALLSGSYRVVVTDNLGCTDTSRTVNINLHPQPAAGFTINNTSQCISGNNFVFTNSSTISSGSLTFLWNFGDGNTANSTNPNHSYTAIGTYSVKLVATSINGCKDSVTQIVSVSNGPLASFTSNNSNQCLNGNNFVFTNTSSTFGTMSYSWSFGDGNSAITTNSTHTYLAAGNYNVKLVATSNNSCKDSSSQQITVFAQPLPAPVTANGPLSFCQGNSVILSTTGASLLQWFRDGSPISVATFNNLLVNQSGTYTVTSTNINGCNSVSTAVVVIINTVPNGILQNPSQNFICQGSTVTLTASGATSYQWYRNATPIAGAVNATYNAGLPGTYTVEFINAGCRRLSNNSIPLSLITSPQTDFSFNSSCENTPVIFNNLSNISGSGPVNYNWNFGDAGTSSLNNPVHTYLSAATYNAKLVVTSIQCPQLKDSIIKMVRVEKALQGIAYTPVNAFINSTVPLVARNIGINYLWVPGTYLNNPTIRTPDVTPVQNQTYLIVITSAAGCITVDTQLVRIFKEKEIYVPNGFSPNNDGSNDKLIPILVGISELKYFRVYDRWGQIVYETKQAGQGWDGYYKGAKQPMDTYNWIAEAIDIDGNVLKRSGATLLLR